MSGSTNLCLMLLLATHTFFFKDWALLNFFGGKNAQLLLLKPMKGILYSISHLTWERLDLAGRRSWPPLCMFSTVPNMALPAICWAVIWSMIGVVTSWLPVNSVAPCNDPTESRITPAAKFEVGWHISKLVNFWWTYEREVEVGNPCSAFQFAVPWVNVMCSQKVPAMHQEIENFSRLKRWSINTASNSTWAAQ